MWTTELSVGFVPLPPEKEELYWAAIRYFAEVMFADLLEEVGSHIPGEYPGRGRKINMQKTIEEIEALKDNWIKDPVWDIETTEGFEAHHDELLAWRNDLETKHRLASQVRKELRFEKVMSETGVATKDIALALQTWDEIESAINYSQRQSDDFDFIAAAQVRATLLMAAQLKRIADALENICDGETLVTTAAKRGNGK